MFKPKIYRSNASIGIGYIALPSDINENNRNDFISSCIRSNRVSILIEDGGGMAHNCYISNEALKNVNFPDKFGETGSPVMFYLHPLSGLPMVVCSFNSDDEMNFFKEGEKVVGSKGEFDSNFGFVSVDGKGGKINISTYAEEDSGGLLNIKINNKSRNAKLNIEVNGSASISTTSDCDITSEANLNIVAKDVDNETESSIKINGTKITFNDSVKGSFMIDINEMVDKINAIEDDINDLKQVFSTWTTIPEDGGAALKTSAATWYAATLTNTTVDDIKDEKIEN